jgi:hypothetical protein
MTLTSNMTAAQACDLAESLIHHGISFYTLCAIDKSKEPGLEGYTTAVLIETPAKHNALGRELARAHGILP